MGAPWKPSNYISQLILGVARQLHVDGVPSLSVDKNVLAVPQFASIQLNVRTVDGSHNTREVGDLIELLDSSVYLLLRLWKFDDLK